MISEPMMLIIIDMVSQYWQHAGNEAAGPLLLLYPNTNVEDGAKPVRW